MPIELIKQLFGWLQGCCGDDFDELGSAGCVGTTETQMRLTAVTLTDAETAPTARVDCRRAERNILKEVCEEKGNERRTIAAEVQLGEGRV